MFPNHSGVFSPPSKIEERENVICAEKTDRCKDVGLEWWAREELTEITLKARNESETELNTLKKGWKRNTFGEKVGLAIGKNVGKKEDKVERLF